MEIGSLYNRLLDVQCRKSQQMGAIYPKPRVFLHIPKTPAPAEILNVSHHHDNEPRPGKFGHCCLLYSPSVVWEVFFHRPDPLVNKVCMTDGITPSLLAFQNQLRKRVRIQLWLIAFMTQTWTGAKARVKNKSVCRWKKFPTECLISKKYWEKHSI